MFRLLAHCGLALLPPLIKIPIYRYVCGYKIGRGVRIGFSPLIVERCRIGDDTRIGHLNLFWRTRMLDIADHVRIGHLNLFRGGDQIEIGRYAEIFRANVVNSIPEPDSETEVTPVFRLGAGSVITTAQWIDFTDQVTIGCRSIIGGRHSSIWTHSRQWTRPITIGDFVYLGSEVRLAPGASIPSYSVVGLGSVIIDALDTCGSLIAGNPARPVKTLTANGLQLLAKKTRRDLPDEIGRDEAEYFNAVSYESGRSA